MTLSTGRWANWLEKSRLVTKWSLLRYRLPTGKRSMMMKTAIARPTNAAVLYHFLLLAGTLTADADFAAFLIYHHIRAAAASISRKLLPASLENEPIEYVGYAASEKEKNVIDKVAVCLIDLRTLVDVFYGTSRQGISREDLRQMLRHILSENFLNH